MNPSLNLRHFFSSIQFLTIIPIKKNLYIDEVALGKSGAFFPLVGFIIGLFLLIVSKFFLAFFPMPISDLLVLTALVLLTGGIHIDGFCDTIDAFASRSNPEETLKIMRDSHLGAIGAMSLFFLLLLKYLSLNNLVLGSKNSILILMPTLGRYSIVQSAFFSAYARTGPGKGRPFTEYIETKEILIALGQTILLSLAILGLSGIIFLALTSVFTFAWGVYVNRRIGGVTGDILGATCEMNEVLVLILALMLA